MNYFNFLNGEFTLLDSKRNRFFLVMFILVFSVLFLNLFVPFNINNWPGSSKVPKFIQLSSYGVLGALSIAITQFLIRRWFNIEQLLLKQFLIFIGFELFFISVLLTVFYGEIYEFKHVFSEFVLTLKYTFLIALIPYSLVLLILSLLQSNSKLKELVKSKNKVVLANEMINFSDDKGNVKFTMPLGDLLYLESTDNYVYIYHISNNELKKELLRNSLKNFFSLLFKKGVSSKKVSLLL